jgi:hypothetical protein
MSGRSLICSCLAFLLLAQSAAADVVVLKSGEKIAGTLANREALRSDLGAVHTVSILTRDSQDLRRFPRGDVRYLILEDPGTQEVIDFTTPSAREPQTASRGSISSRDAAPGIVLTVLGLNMVGVGVIHKFGGPKCTVTESSLDCEKDSYDWTNYTLIGGGALLAIIGIVESTPTRGGSTAVPPPASGPTVSLGPKGSPARFMLSYAYRF